MRPTLRGVALLALAASAGSAAIILQTDHAELRGLWTALTVVPALCFIGTGLFAWQRRPHSHFGALMILAGFLLLGSGLNFSGRSVPFTIGFVLINVFFAAVTHLLVAYPTGRLQERIERWLVGALYALATFGTLAVLLFTGPETYLDCERCPPSAVQIVEDSTAFEIANRVSLALAVLVLAALLRVLWQRRSAQTEAQRRVAAPLVGVGIGALVTLTLSTTAQVVGVPDEIGGVLGVLAGAFVFSIPFVFLFAVLRASVARAGTVGGLLAALGEDAARPRLRAMLVDALGDPSLSLVYWLADRGHYVDAAGSAVTLPDAGDRTRAVERVELGGEPVGAILYDPALSAEEPALVRSVGAAAALAMHNERLEAELRARVADLERSRARLLEVGMAERRRLERNLHDGAQQRLVALSLQLRLAESTVARQPERAVELLAGAQDELARALEELRELARGIHPAVLSERGLTAALDLLAQRSPVPVRIEDAPDGRLPPPVEATAYYVVAEALTNVAKYAGAREAVVRVRRSSNGHAVVEVVDDGIGGADPARGSGLRGLADRLAAVDGRLRIESPDGGGTRLRAEIPCAS